MLIVDAHCDTLWAAPHQGRDWITASHLGHVDLPRLIEGGVGIQFFALFSDPAHRDTGFTVKALEMINLFYGGLRRAASASPSTPLGVILTSDDVAKARHGFWGLLSIEGGEAIGGSLGALEALFRLGVRAMGLVWNHRNQLAEGVSDDTGSGLTSLGRRVVQAMEEWGMIVDVSHLNDAGFWDVDRIARRPFIASHSNARALCAHPRNLTDSQIKALAARGGVMGINFHGPFLRESGRATLDDVIAHIDYIASLIGIAHVGLGSDFDGIPEGPEGLDDVTRLRRVADALLQRGYSEFDVRAVMGENFMRLLQSLLPTSSPEPTGSHLHPH